MLKIFGQHGENTVQQLQACLDAGGGHGVLCADGHKGYSQPVGGVIRVRMVDSGQLNREDEIEIRHG